MPLEPTLAMTIEFEAYGDEELGRKLHAEEVEIWKSARDSNKKNRGRNKL